MRDAQPMEGGTMEDDRIWHHIHAERATLAAHLGDLSDAEWQGPTLCAGWTVHDVAAHVIAHPRSGGVRWPGCWDATWGAATTR